MEDLLAQMPETEQDLVGNTYVLDSNCLDGKNRLAPEYVLADDFEEPNAQEKQIFAALRGAAEKKYGMLQDLPR